MSAISTVSASAPGKVLIIGGYLVVEAPNTGISIGVDARFKTDVTVRPAAAADQTQQEQSAASRFSVIVESPQFGKTFEFFLHQDHPESGLLVISQEEGSPRAVKNPFLAHSILYSFAFLLASASASSSSPTTKLADLFPSQGQQLCLVLRADNDFYSQQNWLTAHNLELCVDSLRKVPQYAPLIGDVSKTGLGSSAALTASVVAALIRYGRKRLLMQQQQLTATDSDSLKKEDDDIPTLVESIHRVAQCSHCVAQGKIGSGFDVYTACYGTCAYSRFAASRIEPLMKKQQSKPAAVSAASEGRKFVTVTAVDIFTLATVVVGADGSAGAGLDTAAAAQKADPWIPVGSDGGASFRSLPPQFKLLLADIHAGGSETPGMVQKVFAWRNTLDAADSNNMWNRVARANSQSIRVLSELCRVAEQKDSADAYQLAASEVALRTAVDEAAWAVTAHDGDNDADREGGGMRKKQVAAIFALFNEVRLAFRECRRLLREVGVQAAVEIEPAQLTPLLEATLANCPGVIAVGCPGAGGYDAVFALGVERPQQVPEPALCTRVEKFWERYKEGGLHVCPLAVREGGGGLSFE